MESSLNSLLVSESGRVAFSGLGSKIDWQGAVDAIIKAKRIPVDRLETRITRNDAKIAAFQEFRSHLNVLKDSLKKLYGAVSVDRSQDIFEAKQAFATASRTDGGAPSKPTDLIGVTVTNRAAAGSHSIEVIQTAASHKVGSASLTSTTADLGTARGLAANSIAGSFEIAGKRIDVSANDSLQNLVDRINNANTGASPTGVSASIIRVSATENYLALTVTETGKTLGADIALADTDGVLGQLGVLGPAGGFANELQAARKAQFHADGLLAGVSYSSQPQADSTAKLNSGNGKLQFQDTAGNVIAQINYNNNATLESIAAAIDADPALAAAGIGAVIEGDAGNYTLRIQAAGNFTMVDTGTLSTTLGMTQQTKVPLVIERSSNTISDLFTGVTLNLYQAEPGTTVRVDIERNLTQVKEAITGFVDAYNNVRQFLNLHLDTDPSTGKPYEDAVLFGSRALADVESRLGQVLGNGAEGVSRAFSVLAQIGVGFVNNNTLDDPLRVNNLQMDSEKLDQALLANLPDVKKLFTFDFASSDPRVSLLGFNGKTNYSATGYQLDIDYDEAAGQLAGATINDGSASVSGKSIAIGSGPAAGLRLFFNGDADVNGVQIDFTVGVGAQMFFDLETVLDQKSGVVETEIKSLTTQNEQSQTRIDEMLVRIELQRESLLARFTHMETALATMERILESVKQMTDSMFPQKK